MISNWLLRQAWREIDERRNVAILQSLWLTAPCWPRAYENAPHLFPGQKSYEEPKPGFVLMFILCYSIFSFIGACRLLLC